MNNEEFYIGQIFEGSYSPAAATWCNNNKAKIVEIESVERDVEESYINENEEEQTRTIVKTFRRYEIQAVPEPPAPTHDDISQLRIMYRREHIDDKTLERMRKIANGTWTEEDEQEYLELDAEVTAYIETNYSYPEDRG